MFSATKSLSQLQKNRYIFQSLKQQQSNITSYNSFSSNNQKKNINNNSNTNNNSNHNNYNNHKSIFNYNQLFSSTSSSTSLIKDSKLNSLIHRVNYSKSSKPPKDEKEINENEEDKEKQFNDDDTIDSLSKEISLIDKSSNKKRDWPLNDEVLVFSIQSIPFSGAKGSLLLNQRFIDNMIPNIAGRTFIGLFLQKDGNKRDDPNSIDEIPRVGVLAHVSMTPVGHHYFEALKRIRIKRFITNTPPFCVEIEPYEPIETEDPKDPKIVATVEKITNLLERFDKQYPDAYRHNSLFFKQQREMDNPEIFISAATILYGLNYPAYCQEILETPSIVDRLEKIYQLLLQEEKLLKVQQEISVSIEEKKSNEQKKLLLNEQLKKIKSELGVELDEKEKTIQKFRDKLSKLNVPEAQKKVIEDEITKISTIEPSSVEFNMSRNYLEWLTSLPWGIFSQEFFDLTHSKQVLDCDHYGLNEIKQRILEFISVGHLKGTVQGKILCFIGPPGTGKTTIAKSIAKCLKREFYRFSVGGVNDEGEIKGHRRTYVGSMPGKLLQALKMTQTSNPVILIDEIDKMGKKYHSGDPSSALLEVLDSDLNSTFVDHFLDVPYDLSRVLFICTANSNNIPPALFDRMEIIPLAGYVEEEQYEIVKSFIIPKTLIESGLKVDQISISDSVIQSLVRFYTREVGIRELERMVEKIMRKTALMLVSGEAERVVVDQDNVHSFLGIPQYTSGRYYEHTPVGVVNGLAYTPKGGHSFYIETIAEEGKPVSGTPPRLRTTGKLGEVMLESSSIAYTFAKNFLYFIDPNNNFFETHNLHMHFPEGAIPKEGPSAGIAIVTSLLSLALNEPALNNLGMTGEVTITGKVLPIGGVKEKTIGAKRSSLKTIIFPATNRVHFEELASYVKEGIDVQYASDYKDVFVLAFPNKKDLLENAIQGLKENNNKQQQQQIQN
ncbi:hypothetical protein CYY_008567 [Polysphondylium violaceum]|uniref:endopeptidase La n=1 Tax=Polysphondylium violaceum TaxID=133409 RepID=A0A8J4PN67_9MYCE|nr:hypothetical protein CYY_008567 [Polysphondylium violaceum]